MCPPEGLLPTSPRRRAQGREWRVPAPAHLWSQPFQAWAGSGHPGTLGPNQAPELGKGTCPGQGPQDQLGLPAETAGWAAPHLREGSTSSAYTAPEAGSSLARASLSR